LIHEALDTLANPSPEPQRELFRIDRKRKSGR
jgi:hypothetical protein